MKNIWGRSQPFFSDWKQIKWLPANTSEYDKSGERSIKCLSPVSLQFDPWLHEASSNYKFKNILSLIMNILNPLYLYGTSTRNSKAYKYLKSNLCKVSKKFGIFLVKSCEIKVVFWTKPSQWSQCVFTKFFKLFLSASSSYSRFYIFIFLLFLFLFRDLVKLDFENY